MTEPAIRGEWRAVPNLRRRHYVYDGQHSMCRPAFGREDWQVWGKGHLPCPECMSHLNEARTHRAADTMAGKKWECMCAHCRKARAVE